MNQEPKAIETEYKGYRFRSKLEARWAVLFDLLNIKYEYEPEGFEVKDGTRYLPDFYLPFFDMYAEVKPPREGALEELIKPLKCVEERAINRIVFLSNIPYDERKRGCLWWYPFAYYDNMDRKIGYARVGLNCYEIPDTNKMEGNFIDSFRMCHWETPFCCGISSFDDSFKKFILDRGHGLLSPINDLDMPYKDGFHFSDTFDENEINKTIRVYKMARSCRFGPRGLVA